MSIDPAAVSLAETVRVAAIFATHWQCPERGHTQPFDGTVFAEFADHFSDQLERQPKIVAHQRDVPLRIDTGGLHIRNVEAYLFALPSDQIVAMLRFECVPPESLDGLDRILDELAEDPVRVGDQRLPDFLASIAPHGLVTPPGVGNPLSIRHEVVAFHESHVLSPALIDNVLYRRRGRYHKGFSKRLVVDELTTPDENTQGIVTANATLVQGHGALLEGSVLLSTAQTVGARARFREIRSSAFDIAYQVRRDIRVAATYDEQRTDLEQLSDALSDLEFDLTVAVELPLSRSEAFHDALATALGIPEEAARLRDMLMGLGNAVRAELTALEIRESRAESQRISAGDITNQLITIVNLVVLGFFTFLGINARQVDGDRSMFSGAYVWAFAFFALMALVPVAFSAARLVAGRMRARRTHRPR